MKKYSEIREQLSTGDVVLFHRQEGWRGFVSWIISKVTGSPFTHCGMVLKIGERIMLVEARETMGVTMRPLSDIQVSFKIFHIEKITGFEEVLADEMLSKIGAKYDWFGAFLAAFKLPRKNNRWFCSEFVGEVLERAEYHLHKVPTPADINNYLEKNNTANVWVKAPK